MSVRDVCGGALIVLDLEEVLVLVMPHGLARNRGGEKRRADADGTVDMTMKARIVAKRRFIFDVLFLFLFSL